MDANDVMTHEPVCFKRVEKLSTILQVLKLSNHNGFPVIGNNQGHYLGTITRDELYVLINNKQYSTNSNLLIEYNGDTQSLDSLPLIDLTGS